MYCLKSQAPTRPKKWPRLRLGNNGVNNDGLNNGAVAMLVVQWCFEQWHLRMIDHFKKNNRHIDKPINNTNLAPPMERQLRLFNRLGSSRTTLGPRTGIPFPQVASCAAPSTSSPPDAPHSPPLVPFASPWRLPRVAALPWETRPMPLDLLPHMRPMDLRWGEQTNSYGISIFLKFV